MKKLKAFLSLFVVLSLFLCLATACGTGGSSDSDAAFDAESDVVGKWYNAHSKCLDIRSDGTWTLDDEYGTGKWQLLEDGTYEFLDFYGQAQNTVMSENESGPYITFGYYGDFYKDYYPSPNAQNADDDNGEGTAIQFLQCTTNNNFYVVEFQMGEQTYCGVADANGEIFYYTEDTEEFYSNNGELNNYYFYSMGENAGYFYHSNESGQSYTILNTSGKQTTFSEDDFDKILGAGGGYLFVYKNTGDISREEHSYGLINGNGEWEIPLTPGTKLPDDKQYTYAGEKVFIWSDYYGWTEHTVVFDCAKNIAVGFTDSLIESKTVNNGKFVVSADNIVGGYYSFPYGSENGGSFSDDSDYLFSTDGSYEAIPEMNDVFNKVAVYEETGYMQILDLESRQVVTYDDYPADSVLRFSFVDKYGLVVIRGQDGNNYLTVIDVNGNQQFEPLKCSAYDKAEYFKFYGDRTIYQTADGYYQMIDNQGNVILSEDRMCTRLDMSGDLVSGTYVSGTTSDAPIYFDRDGKEIVFHLKG